MRQTLRNIYLLYKDGFAQMRLGRILWTVIIIKLLIIFAILKVFFFPDYLKKMAPDGDKAVPILQARQRRTVLYR